MRTYENGIWQPLMFHVCFTLNMKEKMELMTKVRLAAECGVVDG